MSFHLSRLKPGQWDEAARLLHASLSDWYEKNLNQPGKFGARWEPLRIFPQVYGTLDPGMAITACDDSSGQLLGICFYHPRETHVSLGIVGTAPAAGRRGVARTMVEEALRLASEAGLPVRLVSSAMSLDSFSLYTRLGFVPHTLFQDMILPERKQPLPLPRGSGRVRVAGPDDAAAIADFEYRLHGIRRLKDYRYFLENREGIWSAWVSETEGGGLDGFLCAVSAEGSQMLGPGVMAGEAQALALIHAAHASRPNWSPVFLVPSAAPQLIAALYQRGARNLELHVAQCAGPCPAMQGISMPTFMPETG
jgi:GNAT superfamily N-acetyltransferase